MRVSKRECVYVCVSVMLLSKASVWQATTAKQDGKAGMPAVSPIMSQFEL